MVAVSSTMLPLGTRAPEFELPSALGGTVSLRHFAGRPTLIMFICNHCPFVKHVREGLAALVKEYRDKGIAALAINANDWTAYPEDGPEQMAREAQRYGYTFPYLYDRTQEAAKAFRAACTPDFYLFDGEHRLVYRGQMDDSRPGNGEPVTGRDLRAAMDALLAGRSVPAEQKPSIGCNIKWRPNNEPDYFK
ncbi:MAG: thioredoxin family protein [bacterium]